jgi:membrane-bound inhibitor of C-type lysozyme
MFMTLQKRSSCAFDVTKSGLRAPSPAPSAPRHPGTAGNCRRIIRQEFPMKTFPLFGLLLFVHNVNATALSVPQVQIHRVITADYRCPGGKHFTVTYLNANSGQSFAVMPYQGKTLLLVNTLSADGVKYQADAITWWIKGRSGTLFDLRSDPNRAVLDDCTTQ